MKRKILGEKWKLFNFLILIVGIIVYFVAEIFWRNMCVASGCEYAFMAGILSPLKSAGIILSLLFFLFLFFPQSYFKQYITRWFWWLLLIAYVITIGSDPIDDSIMQFDRAFVVSVLGSLGLVHAIVFLFLHHRKHKQAVGIKGEGQG